MFLTFFNEIQVLKSLLLHIRLLLPYYSYHILYVIFTRGQNIVKGATQVSGDYLKLHFYMFERSKKKHNSLDCHNCF
jgi:hypothetical protein